MSILLEALASVQAVVENMWAEFLHLSPLQKLLTLIALPAVGSIFPLWRRLTSLIASRRRELRLRGRRARVLVIGDHALTVDGLKFSLEREGYAVFGFTDPLEALEQFSKVDPDLVVIDGNMHPINGIETLRRIRNISSVKAVMLTHYNEEFPEDTSLDKGFDDYISKASINKVLISRISAQLRRL